MKVALGWVLGGSENHTEEMEAARDYTNIRYPHFYRLIIWIVLYLILWRALVNSL